MADVDPFATGGFAAIANSCFNIFGAFLIAR